MEDHSLVFHPSTGLYVHIPFCAVKCRFCDFAAFPGRLYDKARYIKALCQELDQRAQNIPRQKLDTIYFGGGTPSVLEPDEWRVLLDAVRQHFDISPECEASLECNPDGVTLEKLVAWRALGLNRLSFGLQSDEPDLLKVLGRTHSWDDFVRVFHLAREQGFQNINVDLMFGLPGQTLDGWNRTVRRVLELNPDHLSAYGLQVEEGTYFHKSGVQAEDDLQAEMYERVADLMESAGYDHYEISNFAIPGHECRHNLRYWRNQECLAVGVSSAWYDGARRHTNTDDLTDYLDAMETERDPETDATLLSPDQREGENLMLALRLKEGVIATPTAKNFYSQVLDRGVRQGLLMQEGDRYLPTRKGWRLSNQLFVDLLTPPK